MSVRTIVTMADDNFTTMLRQPSRKVYKFDKWLVKLAQDMAETMVTEGGVGLAAPQIGQRIRLIVVRGNQPNQFVAMVNPEILQRKGESVDNEGCLSLPGYLAVDVPRAAEVRIKTKTIQGSPYTFWASGTMARVLQHEIDHLNGRLMIDLVPGVNIRRLGPQGERGVSPITGKGEEPNGLILDTTTAGDSVLVAEETTTTNETPPSSALKALQMMTATDD